MKSAGFIVICDTEFSHSGKSIISALAEDVFGTVLAYSKKEFAERKAAELNGTRPKFGMSDMDSYYKVREVFYNESEEDEKQDELRRAG